MNAAEQLKILLRESGLNEAETILYLELINKPAESIWELLQRTKLSKSSAYRAFEHLKKLKLVHIENNLIQASSLKALVAELKTTERNLGKLANKIQKIAPYLKLPKESIETFEQFYTPNQIMEAYLFMSEIDFNVSLDMGDFETFCSNLTGDSTLAFKFRRNRIKKTAINKAICTNAGPITALFCTRESEQKFKNYVECSKLNFNKRFIVFSDNNDYVLFNDMEDPENPSSVLVKSRTIADIQRLNFSNLSQQFGKI